MFAEHRQEGREERGGETGEEDGLDLDHRVRRPGPLWEGGDVVSESGVVDLVNKKAEEGGGLFAGIGLEFGIDLDDKCGGDSRKQTSLCA